MNPIDWVAVAVGSAIVIGTTVSVIKTMVVPRRAWSLLPSLVARGTTALFMFLARRMRSFDVIDRFLGFLAPSGNQRCKPGAASAGDHGNVSGGAEDCRAGFRPGGGGAVVNSSRGITFAFAKGDHGERFGDSLIVFRIDAVQAQQEDAQELQADLVDIRLDAVGDAFDVVLVGALGVSLRGGG